MLDCIDACKQCHDVCLEMAMTHCLSLGGKHVEGGHLRLMINCAEICQTSANFMLSNSSMHAAVCAVCAEVCDACARNCEQIGDMDACVQACRRCATSCEQMGRMQQPVQGAAAGTQFT
jgi:hypothetical protein